MYCRQDGVVSELGNRSAADFLVLRDDVFIEDRPRGMNYWKLGRDGERVISCAIPSHRYALNVFIVCHGSYEIYLRII